MFRGEPIALKTILTGFVFFILTQILGLMMPGLIITNNLNSIIQSHFIAAFFGWIGLVILGAQLQFFRAISVVRKYGPDFLRPVYYWSLFIGILSLIIGNLLLENVLVYLGLFLLGLGIIIHTYWIVPQINSKLFKFPLNYLTGAHVFLIISYLYYAIQIIDSPFSSANNYELIHVLGVGWISLSLMGAMIRALPMFFGNVIDRTFRKYIDQHFWFSFLAAGVFSIAFLLEIRLGYIIGGTAWVLSWIWVIYLLISSIFLSDRDIDMEQSLYYFAPGLIFLILGAFLGFASYFSWIDPIHRGLHIHTTLLSGLALVMMGAIQRVTSFQIYTLLYTGRRDVDIRLEDFLKLHYNKFIAPMMILGPLLMLAGFYNNQLMMVGHGALLVVIGTIVFGLYLLGNVVHYISNIDDAIPFDKKPSEVDNN